MKKRTLSLLSVIAAGGFTLAGCTTEPADTTGKPAAPETKNAADAKPTPPVPPPFGTGEINDEEGSKPTPPPPPPPFNTGEVDSLNNETEATEEEVEASAGTGFTDGTYTSAGSYSSPAGQEEIDVQIVLENGTITGVSVIPKSENSTSKDLQQLFAQGVPSVVVGKKIEEIESIAAINGASLTGKGFMRALDAIKDEASI
jgi:uncharacterized protein with FMN-binding domain